MSAAVLFAQTWSLDLAVCGGGHSTSGASSSAGGLVIDLSQMRNVIVDPFAKIIKAQGGCTWEDVDKAAGEHSLATVGGTVNHTGIGGLTLGGGYGWLSGEHGLTIDNLLWVQIVLADGSIVTASDSENGDLFWAIRGAGQSFGVVIEFAYRAHEQKSPVWAGQLVYPPSQLEALVEIANELLAAGSDNSGLVIAIAAPPPLFQPIAHAAVFYNGPTSAAESFFAPLLALSPIVNTTSSMPYQQLNAMLNTANPHGGRKVIKGATFAPPLHAPFARSVLDDYLAFRLANPGVTAVIIFEFLPSRKVCQVPHAATAFANRGEYQNAVVNPQWTHPSQDEACRTWARGMAMKFEREMTRRKDEGGVHLAMEGVGQYGNYDGFQESGSLIFGQNLPRLQALKLQYDPGNLFNKGHLQI